jgi:phosphoribosylaminoimidazolecarboxamide formyltransferase/IMP cyclohydrolase
MCACSDRFLPAARTDWDNGRNAMDVKRVGSGLLVQTADNHELRWPTSRS